MKIVHSPNKTAGAQALAGALDDILAEPTPTLLLASGGSALNIFDYLAPLASAQQLALGIVDERITSHTPDQNTTTLLGKPWVQNTLAQGASNGLLVPTDNETPTDYAQRYQAWLQTQLGQLQRVLVILGIGPDSHTAGIMPRYRFGTDEPFEAPFANNYQDWFDNPDTWVVGYNAEPANPHHYRATVTFSFLRTQTTQAFGFIFGDDKQPAWDQIKTSPDPERYPGAIIHDLPHCTVYTDLQ